jgi:hypothetical protein
MISLSSLQNLGVIWWEERFYRARVERARVDPPLFILGIWRSGTTHLHNLLAQDRRFAYPNNYEVYFPRTFLITEKRYSKIIGRFFPDKRPQDNMTIRIDEPQEDEFALCSLTSGCFATGWAFPRRREYYDRYLTLRDLDPSELAEWKATLRAFVQKLAYTHGRPLILKSPGHTCRIKVLLDLFPDARFVHIHRNPFDVFRSTEHMLRTVSRWWALQRPNFEDLEARILREYREVYDAHFEERPKIPPGRFHEIGFEALEADPIGQLRQLYEALALPEFGSVEPYLRRYMESVADYKKNKFFDLKPDLRDRIAREWHRSFQEWGYAT